MASNSGKGSDRRVIFADHFKVESFISFLFKCAHNFAQQYIMRRTIAQHHLPNLARRETERVQKKWKFLRFKPLQPNQPVWKKSMYTRQKLHLFRSDSTKWMACIRKNDEKKTNSNKRNQFASFDTYTKRSDVFTAMKKYTKRVKSARLSVEKHYALDAVKTHLAIPCSAVAEREMCALVLLCAIC